MISAEPDDLVPEEYFQPEANIAISYSERGLVGDQERHCSHTLHLTLTHLDSLLGRLPGPVYGVYVVSWLECHVLVPEAIVHIALPNQFNLSASLCIELVYTDLPR